MQLDATPVTPGVTIVISAGLANSRGLDGG